MIFLKKNIVFFLIFGVSFLYAEHEKKYFIEDNIEWLEPALYYSSTDSIRTLYFNGAHYDFPSNLPLYTYIVDDQFFNPIVNITDFVFDYEPLTKAEKSLIEKGSIDNEFNITSTLKVVNKKTNIILNINPIRKNLYGELEKLTSFSCNLFVKERIEALEKKDYRNSSVLSTGDWYKIAVTNDGVYKITHDFIANLGINPSSINPKKIRLFGNGGGMLPEQNSLFRYDGLKENAIYVQGENDESFDNTDYVLFYGKSPHIWQYDTLTTSFSHIMHLYSDTTFYFLNFDLIEGKRVQQLDPISASPTHFVTTYDDYFFHEKEDKNIKSTGRQWFGEYFDLTLQHDFNFNIPNINLASDVEIIVRAIAHSTISTSYNVLYNNLLVGNIPIGAISGSSTSDYVKDGMLSTTFQPIGSNLNLSVVYQDGNHSSSLGWLDYIEIVTRRYLTMDANQKIIRDRNSVGLNHISEFSVLEANSLYQVWDITNPINIVALSGQLTGNEYKFLVNTDTLREFILFNNTGYLTPTFIKQVPNQNLHGSSFVDFIIITPSQFFSEAQRLADYHIEYDGMSVLTVTTEQVYNEFSSGAQDITAIRDFIRMLYVNATTSEDEPKYLLLFGDASYDYKNRVSPNTNFVPIYEPFESYSLYNSFATDDYYGFLDNNEGNNMSSDFLDIGIGRFTVTTIDEAKSMVDKVIRYTNSESFGDWRNKILFVADDVDDSWEIILVNGAEDLAQKIDTLFQEFNVNKIYTDAYQQVLTPGGERYPDANADIRDNIEEGALLINYVGHGGEVGWATERILELSDINGWNNNDQMTVFITITCEFSRLDDPERVSAGELTFLNPNGAAIALFSTTRVVYVGPGSNLNNLFYDHVFERENNEFLTFGEIMKRTKNGLMDIGKRNYSLLGDPALQIACPKYKVVTTSINGEDANQFTDTINALSLVTISGKVVDENNNILTDFNGTVFPTVYDKPTTRSTLDNNNQSASITFKEQKNILYKGIIDVIAGNFTFSFIVPKDIAYNYDFGKISYYANDSYRDAAGYFKELMVGGSNSNAPIDEQGPEISLFMNDDNFLFGGITDENPDIYAIVSDENGINTVGNGIGHDIVAILDEETSNPIILNNYYLADLNSYQSGKIRYPLYELSDGRHMLSVKVWDVYNNSAEDYTEFVVVSSEQLAIEHVLNYPNPFNSTNSNTNFQFEHNRPDEPLEISIQIFDIQGNYLKSIKRDIISSGYRVSNITWDGTNDAGGNLAGGIYVYKVQVKSLIDNSKTYTYEKLVLLR